MFQRGLVHFDFTDKMHQIVMDELALFDYSKRRHGRDDFVDTTVNCLTRIDEWFRRRKKHKTRKGELYIMWEPNSPIYGGRVTYG